MKKITILINIIILFSGITYAQTTAIPDSNFEQALIDSGYDTVLDGSVLTASISNVMGLDVSNKNISDLTGIEDFTDLLNLNCSSNQLTNLDVTQNTALTELRCNSNLLTNIDLSQNLALLIFQCNNNQIENLNASVNSALIGIQCANNQLTSIDVSQNIALTDLWCFGNQLTNLDVSINTALLGLRCQNNQLTSLNLKNGNNTSIIGANFNATSNPNLICIQVDDANYSTINWTSIDVQTSFNEDCSQQGSIFIPDDSFEQALIDLGYDSGALDDFVPTANINTILTLDVSNKNIFDFTGINSFTALQNLNISNNPITQSISFNINNLTALTELRCFSNQLTSLDVSANTGLTLLFCSNNQLTNLDVSQNTVLSQLRTQSNQLSSLDLSQNTALTVFYAQNNLLMNLDFTQNTVLEDLRCQNNQLTSLNIKNGNNTTITNFNATNNPNLICIEVDIVAYSTINWTNIDAQTSFDINCSNSDNTCALAQSITVTTTLTTINFDLTNESINYETGCDGATPQDYADVWFEFTMPINGNLNINGFNIWNNFSVYEDCSGIGSEIHCGTNNVLIENLSSGINYKLRVYRPLSGINSGSQSFTIQAFENVANDTCNTAENISISTNSTTINFETSAAEINNEVGCNGTAIEDYLDIWYEFTMPENGNIIIEGSVVWNNIAIYDTCNGTEIGCINDNGTIANLINGNTYKLRVFRTLTNTNQSFKSFMILYQSTLSIETFSQNEVSIFPNPATNVVTIQTPQYINVTKVEIFDISGKQIQTASLVNNTLNVNHLNSGLFFIAITANQNTVVKKLIVR